MIALKLYDKLSTITSHAKVFVESDHGGVPESAHGILVTFNAREEVNSSYYGEDLDWICLSKVPEHKHTNITGVLISA